MEGYESGGSCGWKNAASYLRDGDEDVLLDEEEEGSPGCHFKVGSYFRHSWKADSHTFCRGLTSSGKSTTFRLLTNQLLALSSHTRKETSLASQIKHTILDAFSNSKTWNDNASRHSKFLSLHFSPSKGRIAGVKFIFLSPDDSIRMVETRTSHQLAALGFKLQAEAPFVHIYPPHVHSAPRQPRVRVPG